MSQTINHQKPGQAPGSEISPEKLEDNKHEDGQSAPELSAEEIGRQVELILGSRHFRQAKSLEKFLRYAVAKKLAGAENELKEYTIGVEVFQRGSEYDPRRDAVVRVQANMLRKRLASYYLEEGARDRLIIELPKGHYVPEFHLRPMNSMPVQIAEEPAMLSPDLWSLVPSSIRHSWVAPWFIAATFVLGLLTAFAFQHWQDKAALTERKELKPSEGMSPSAPDPAYLPLWGKFLEPGMENLLTYGTPQFFEADGFYIRHVETNSPEEAGNGSRLMSLRRASHLNLKPSEVYTGVGETHGVYLLTRFFSKMASDLRVTRSRMVNWDEIKNANIIFLSSMRFHTMAKELPYPSDFAINPGISSGISNLHPKPGEPAIYGAENKGEHAVITVWPGKLHQRRIIILNGSTTWATLAAAEYVTDPEYLRQLNQQLEQCRIKAGTAQHAPYFQVVLCAEVKDNQPVSINYVTHHDLQIGDPTDDSINPAPRHQIVYRVNKIVTE